MYAVLQNGKPIAFHDELDVVKTYCNSIEKNGLNQRLRIKKISNKKISRIKDIEDYYLVRLGDSYIQSKYSSIASINNDQLLYDLKYTKDVLYRILETSDDLKKKYLNAIKKTIAVIEMEIDEINSSALDINTLEEMTRNFQSYKDQIDIFDAENKPWLSD